MKRNYKQWFLMLFTPPSLRVYLIAAEQHFPKVSVIMAVYNKAPYLRQSLDSVIKQNMANFELICVDAASTDSSLQILEEYSDKDPRIKVYCTAYSRIPAVTKNYGIARSKGDYVFNLDADDYLRFDTLKKMYIKAKETGADAVIPDLQTVSETGQNLPVYLSGIKGNRGIMLSNRQAVTESLDWGIHGFALWRGDLLRRIRLEEFGAYSDEYSTRVLFFDCRTVAFSEGIYFHRFSGKSLTGKLSLQLCDRPYATYKVASFLEKYSFNQKNIDSQHFAAFKDCCYLLNARSRLAPKDTAEAERRIRLVYNQIDMQRVRKSVCTLKPGRAAMWPPHGKVKKFLFALLTLLGWGVLKRVPLKYLFS